MTKLIIAGHGGWAGACLASLRMIAGGIGEGRIRSVDFRETDALEDLESRLEEAADALCRPGDFLIIGTDLQSGGPFNAAFLAGRRRKLALIYGINMPLLLELAMNLDRYPDQGSLAGLIAQARQATGIYWEDKE